MKFKANYIMTSSIACFIVCSGEFIVLFVFGAFYPGYNHLKDTMSLLGSSWSPVSDETSLWWIIAGVLLIFFASGFKKAFSTKGKFARIGSLLIVLYGLGEGIGSGVFKADRILGKLSVSAIIHDILGGIGVAAILILPLIMQKVVTKKENTAFYRMSKIIFITGIVTVLLFLFRYSANQNNFFSVNKGLWQRLFMLNTYVYLVTIAIIMIKSRKYKQ